MGVKVGADKLILLADIPGVFALDKNGRLTNKVIGTVKHIRSSMIKKANSVRGSKLSVGGIVTKLIAAKRATSAGIETWISSGKSNNSIERILRKDPSAGTRFLPWK